MEKIKIAIAKPNAVYKAFINYIKAGDSSRAMDGGYVTKDPDLTGAADKVKLWTTDGRTMRLWDLPIALSGDLREGRFIPYKYFASLKYFNPIEIPYEEALLNPADTSRSFKCDIKSVLPKIPGEVFCSITGSTDYNYKSRRKVWDNMHWGVSFKAGFFRREDFSGSGLCFDMALYQKAFGDVRLADLYSDPKAPEITTIKVMAGNTLLGVIMPMRIS